MIAQGTSAERQEKSNEVTFEGRVFWVGDVSQGAGLPGGN